MVSLIDDRMLNQKIGGRTVNALEKPFEVIDGLAIIRVYGVITDYSWWGIDYNSIIQFLEDVKADKNIKGVALIVDSAGGMVYKNTEVYELLSSIENTVAFVENICCSASYWLASACDKIVATSKLARIGSIGVCSTIYKPDNIIEVTNTNSPAKRLDYSKEENKRSLQQELDYIYELFVGDITKKRNIDKTAMDGRVFSTDEALKLGLIDGIDINCDIKHYFNKEEKMDNKELMDNIKSMLSDVIEEKTKSLQDNIAKLSADVDSMKEFNSQLKIENDSLKSKLSEVEKNTVATDNSIDIAKTEKDKQVDATNSMSIELVDDNSNTTDYNLAKRNTLGVVPAEAQERDPVVEAVLGFCLEDGSMSVKK